MMVDEFEAPASRVRPIESPRPRLQLARTAVAGLHTHECCAYLAAASIGRLAVIGDDGAPDIFPMNYVVHDGCVYLRSAPGTKLVDIVNDPNVAFEVDGSDGPFEWSVVIRGTAARLDSDREIEASGVLDLVSDTPTAKYDFIRITPSRLSGRRFRPVDEEARS